jgi:hypothetical protein
MLKKMMGGLCYMIDDKMYFGIIKSDLMARVGVYAYEELIEPEGGRSMDFTKRPMKGYIYIALEGVDFQSDLEFWIQKALDFNPMAVARKRRNDS